MTGFSTAVNDTLSSFGVIMRGIIIADYHQKITLLAMGSILALGAAIACFYFAPIGATILGSNSLFYIINGLGVGATAIFIPMIIKTICTIKNFYNDLRQMNAIRSDWNNWHCGRS